VFSLSAAGEVVSNSMRALNASALTVADNLVVEGELTVEGTNVGQALAAAEPAFTAVAPLSKVFNATEGRLELRLAPNALSPYWVAGRVRGSDLAVLSSKGRYSFTVSRGLGISTGVYVASWDEPHPDGEDHVSFACGEAASSGTGWQTIVNMSSSANRDAINNSTTLWVLTRDHLGNLANGSFTFFIMAPVDTIAASISPFWCAGKIDGGTGVILSRKGQREQFTCNRLSTGMYTITFEAPHPDGKHYIINTAAQTFHAFIKTGTEDPTASGFNIGIINSSNQPFDIDFFFSVLA